MSLFFASGGQSIGVSASASVLPMTIQDWFPLGWTVWISLQWEVHLTGRSSPAFLYAELLQLCWTLCNPMDCSPPGSSVHGILPARLLEWVAMPSSRGSSWPRDWTCVSYSSCIGRWVLSHSHHLGSPSLVENPKSRRNLLFFFKQASFPSFLFYLCSLRCMFAAAQGLSLAVGAVFPCQRLLLLQTMGSRVCRFQQLWWVVGLVTLGTWDLSSWTGIKPMSPAMAGGFLTTGPPGKSLEWIQSGCSLFSCCISLPSFSLQSKHGPSLLLRREAKGRRVKGNMGGSTG